LGRKKLSQNHKAWTPQKGQAQLFTAKPLKISKGSPINEKGKGHSGSNGKNH